MPVVTLLVCVRTTRSTPSELINWSTFLTGLDIDKKNEFVSHFPQFESESIQTTGRNEIHSNSNSSNNSNNILCFSESVQLNNNISLDGDNGVDYINNGSSNVVSSALLTLYPESIVLPEITKYLNRLDSMGFNIISSTVDSSVETNCNKKCYIWTLQTKPVQFNYATNELND